MCVWMTTADFLNLDNTEILNCLYVNSAVERFLSRSSSGGISACKGMGKTFLLKAKRMQMMLNHDLTNDVIILPKDQLVDTPGPILLDKGHIHFLQSYSNWVDLWISCISIYLLSIDEIRMCVGNSEIQMLDSDVQNLIKLNHTGIFSVLNTVLINKSRERLRETVRASGLLFHLFQKINRTVYLFVDKLEEPFNRYFYKVPGSNAVADGKCNPSLWSYMQLGFAEAVLRLYSGRHHVKIFFGIRQEALYGCEFVTQEPTKIRNELITKLEYTFSDLQKMFEQYVRVEKPQNLLFPELAEENPYQALCGIDTIHHRSGHDEHVWSYLYRHTFQRPRDIMEMALALYENIVQMRNLDIDDNNAIVRTCRHWVNEISTRQCMDYLTSLEPFMALDDNITFTQNLMNFLKGLPTNVFTNDSIKMYCHNSNVCALPVNCSACNCTHFSPLCTISASWALSIKAQVKRAIKIRLR